MTKNASFPRWSGPLVGLVVGVAVSLSAVRQAEIPVIFVVIGGAVFGLFAGCAILLLEPASSTDSHDDEDPWQVRVPSQSSGIVGRFLALSGIALCWTPVLGLVLNLIGLAVNWRSSDWAKRVSIIGSVIGLLFSLVLVGMILAN